MSSSSNKTWRWLLLGISLSGLIFCCFALVRTPVHAAAGINQQLNFQGRLLNSSGATVPDGVYNIEFKIYQDGDGQSVGDTTGSPAGALKWTENHLVSASTGVVVRNGYLSVQLGSVNPFGSSIDWNQDTLWLSVNIGNLTSCTITTSFNSNCGGDGEMVPMKRLSANPYAFDAGLLGGLASSQFVQLAQGLQTDASTNTNSIYINKTGSGGNFIDLQASGTDAFTLTNSGDITFGNNANHTVSVTTAGSGTAGRSLTISAGAAGTGGSALAGGSLVLQGGTGGGTNGNGGDITIDAGAANGSGSGGNVNIGNANASAVNIATNGVSHSINVGNGAAVQAITIGSTNSTSSLLLQAGTGNLSIQTQGGTLGIGNNPVAQSIVIGNTTGATSITLQSGSGGISLNSTTTVAANLTVTNAGNVAFQKGTDFSTTGPSNNVNFGTGALIRLTGASAQTITGIAGGVDGRILTIVNAAGQAATISNLSGSSSGANQIVTGTGSDLSLAAGASIYLTYDTTTSVWRVVGSAASNGTGFVQLQGSTPGTRQTGNINVSGAVLGSTFDVDSGLTTTLGIGTSSASTINIGTNNAAHTIAIGNGSAAQTITIGSTTTGSSLLLQAGNPAAGPSGGTLYLQTTGGSVGIANNASQQSVIIGNTTSATSVTVFCGTGTCSFGAGATNHSTNIGSTNSGAATTVQGGSGASAVVLQTGNDGVNTAGNIQIGNTTGAFNQTINVGNNATAGSSTTIVIGSTVGSSPLTLQAGTGGASLDAGTGNITIGTSANNKIVSVGATGSTANTTTVNIANTTGNAAQTVNIGATNNANNSVLIQGGTTSAAISLQTGTSGTIAIGTNNTANTIQIGSTTLSSGTQAINIGANNTSGGTTNVTIGSGSSATGGVTALQAKGNITVTTNGITRGTFDTSNNLYLGNGASSAAPNNFTIQGTTSTTTAVAGGSLTIQGGGANTGNANGGNLTLAGGAGIGSGVSGLVQIGAGAFSSVTNSTCSSNCTLTQSNIDSYSTVIVNTTTAGITMTLPDPTTTTVNGRIIYITAANGSNDFILEANSGGSLIDVAMRQNSTATMVWNGTDWTAAGASNATTLQATYNNGTNPSTTPEIKLDSTHGTIDIQDADTTIGQDLFNIRASNAGNLGTVLLGVGNNGTVTIRNSTDQQAAFRFQNASSRYVLNVNTQNGYFINNGTRASGNDIINPGFEAGTDTGDTTFGEQGWFGSPQAVVVNSTSDAHSGNYELQVTPSGANLDVYANGYFEVNPGDTVYFEGWVKNSAGTNGTGGIELTFYDKDKSNPTTSTNYASLPGTTYVLKTLSATVPAGKYYVRASATVRSTATTGTYYFDDFLLRRSNTNAPLIVANSADSAAAFQVQSAGNANTLFTANTTDNIVKVGDSTGSNTNTTIFVLDSATSNPTTLTSRDGGLFYRSDTNTIEAVIGGAVYDVCTTAVTCTGYAASASSSVQLQSSSPGTIQSGNFAITGTGILTQLQTQDLVSGNTNGLTIRTGNATSGNSGNLTIDTGTASGTAGSITFGHSGVTTTMPGNLIIQGTGALELGTSSSATGSITLHNNVGSRTVTIAAAGANPTVSSWTLTLPQDPGSSGDCVKTTDNAGTLGFGNCTAGATTTLQDVYNNSSSPATITLANSKDLQIVAQDTAADPNVLVNLQCTTCVAGNGRFAVQNNGTDVFVVSPNGGNIVVGSATTNGTQTNFQLDSYNGSSDSGTCSTTVNQGALYYNTTMASIRGCVNGSWSDISNPDTLGLLTFGIVPSSGNNPYDIPALITSGVSGPCKVSWADATHVTIQPCTAYSGGRRVNITGTGGTPLSVNNGATTPHAALTTTNIWTNLCLDGSGNLMFTAAATSATANLNTIYTTNSNTFNIAAPQLCLATIKGSTSSGGTIDDIYDVRTFTSTIKEAVNFTTAAELGMLADSSTSGLVPAAVCTTGTCSGKLYGVVVASDGSTSSSSPNAIVATVGPAWIKMTAGNSGEFVHSGPTSGYGVTVTSVPNNAFYYSAGNARTAYSTTCSAASNCSASVYVNMLVR